MKKVLSFILLANSISLFAQISEGGMPPSYKNSFIQNKATIAEFNLPSLDTAELLTYNEKGLLPARYGVYKNLSVNIKKEGTRTTLPEGGSIWRYRINSPSGRSIQVFFKEYLVPEGAELFLYDKGYSTVKGAYTELNMREDHAFVVGDVPGKNVIIEYYEPDNVPFSGEIIIGGVGQAYIDIFSPKMESIDDEGFIPVNCSEGKEWQDQKHSVLKYTFSDQQYLYYCTGALINNTASDGTPYFLTAAHCVNTESEASTVMAYFNYENSSCTMTSGYSNQTLAGSTLMTTGSASDYTLLKFITNVPDGYQPYFAGWDITDNPFDSTIGIHHPHGYKKKISVDNDPPVTYEKTIGWDGGGTSPSGTHWEVLFERGTTAGGSSGSPLFNDDKKIIGQLHGGSEEDYYGKIGYSWTHPSGTYPTLKSLLDPGMTGVTTIDGFYPSINLPDAQFFSDFESVCTSSPIELLGYSAFSPISWKWSFVPKTVEYLNGTTNTSQNPIVAFTAEGSYTVGLSVTNNAGTDNLTLDNFVTAGSSLSLEVTPTGMADSCACNFSSVKLKAYGADAYQWALTGTSADHFSIVNSTVNPAEVRLKEGVTLTETTEVKVTVTGIQGTCQNSIPFSIPLLAQENDFISDARALGAGNNGIFSNKCSTIQDGEPVPPADTTCISQMGWCDEYGDGTKLVEHSVWFKYQPAVNQTVKIYSKGMDNQIAVYRAQSYSDVLSGNYQLVAANDDYTTKDFNPCIESLAVNAGQNYWIQVDGSAGGAEGSFSMYITILSDAEDVQSEKAELLVYPQPARDYVMIRAVPFITAGNVVVDLFNPAGAVVYSGCFSGGSESIEIPLESLAHGIYIARITCDRRTFVTRIVK